MQTNDVCVQIIGAFAAMRFLTAARCRLQKPAATATAHLTPATQTNVTVTTDDNDRECKQIHARKEQSIKYIFVLETLPLARCQHKYGDVFTAYRVVVSRSLLLQVLELLLFLILRFL